MALSSISITFSLSTQHNMDPAALTVSVIEILGRTGSRGGVTQVRVEYKTDLWRRVFIRNIIGPVRVGDQIQLMESEREARRLK
jgi:small subunit ribosomal protein S28e